MGVIVHNAIVVTGWQDAEMKEARAKAVEIFNEAFKGYPMTTNAGEELVGQLIQGVTNGYLSFFIAPDGSKEGWPPSDYGDGAREEFTKWLDDKRKNNDYYLDYVEIEFGGDKFGSEIVKETNYDEEDDEEEEKPSWIVDFANKFCQKWERLSEEEGNKIIQQIDEDDIPLISAGNSLHVCESQYIVDDETYRILRYMDYEGQDVERLIKKKDE